MQLYHTATTTPFETLLLISAILIVAVILYRRARRRPIRWIAAIVETENYKFEGDIKHMELREGFHIDVTIKPKTAHNHPAAIQPGSVQLSSTNPAVIGIGPNPDFPDDPLKLRVSGLDGSNNESAGVEWRADGDTGEGVRPVIWTESVVCTQGNAVVADAEVGEPVEDMPETQPDNVPAETPADNAGGGVAEPAGDGGGSEGTGNGDVATADEPIAGHDPENPGNPVEGSEADSNV